MKQQKKATKNLAYSCQVFEMWELLGPTRADKKNSVLFILIRDTKRVSEFDMANQEDSNTHAVDRRLERMWRKVKRVLEVTCRTSQLDT